MWKTMTATPGSDRHHVPCQSSKSMSVMCSAERVPVTVSRLPLPLSLHLCPQMHSGRTGCLFPCPSRTASSTDTFRKSHFSSFYHCSSTWIVYLHTPSVFHSLMVLSRDPDTIWRLSAENATLNTSFVWPTKRRVVRPLHRHKLTLLHAQSTTFTTNIGRIIRPL